jgi:guanylate kinase
MHSGKLIIITAPSGAGKTTVVKHLLTEFPVLKFSVSATTRTMRQNEKHGVDYFFMSVDAFKQKIHEGDFIEWEEVYPGKYYGTLIAEIEKNQKLGYHMIFDVDVIGANNIMNAYRELSLSIFIKPPSEAVLMQRLMHRKTESAEMLAVRMQRAKMELTWENKFDHVIVNNELSETLRQAKNIVSTFLNIG